MTKNIPSKPHHRGGNPKGDKKPQHQSSNATTVHSQNENATATASAVLISVQKASIDLKMLTPEQRRLASLMNDKVDVSEIEKKINKIMELTGASKDKAIVALHDCANELDKAIDMILEGDSINETEWKSQSRKKKPKAGALPVGGKDSVHLNGDAKKGPAGKGGRGLVRGKAQPRQERSSSDKPQSQQQYQQNKSERRPRGDWKSSKEPNNNVTGGLNDESTSTSNNKDLELDDKLNDDDWNDETPSSNAPVTTTRDHTNRDSRDTRERGSRPPLGGNSEFKSYSNRSSYQNNNQDGSRRISSGPRGSYNRDSASRFGQSGDRNNQRSGDRGPNDRSDRRPYQSKGYNAKKPGGGYTNSIDTWSNLTATDSPAAGADYAAIPVGNWSDVVSNASSSAAAVVSGGAPAKPQASQPNDLNNDDEWAEPSDNLTNLEQATSKVFSSKDNQATTTSSASKPDDHLSKMPNLASIVSGVKPQVQPPPQQQPNVHKSPNQASQQSQQQQQQTTKPLPPNQQQILSSSNNQSILKSPQQQQPQRQPQANQASQQNKIDLAALLKSSQKQQTPQQQQTSNLIRGNMQPPQQQRNNQPDSNAYGAALLQRLQQRIHTDQQDPSSLTKTSANLNDYVNHSYGQNKNLVHNIPSNNYAGQQNAPPNLFDNQTHHLHQHHQNVTDQKSLIEKKRRQTKIPETAVEMPTSEHISSLNVQFGALDFTTAADSYGLNDDQMTSKQSQFNLSRDSNNEKNSSASLLSTVRGNQPTSDNKHQQQQNKDSLLQNIDHHHSQSHHPHQLQDNSMLQHADSRNKSQQQQPAAAAAGYHQLNSYQQKNDNSNPHSSIYPPNLQTYQSSYGSVNNYGSQNHNASAHSNASGNQGASGANQQQQKINLKDLSDNSSSNNSQSNSSANATSSSALGNLVNNSTVTTNVLKNSLTATVKTGGIGGNNSMQQQQQLNVAAPPLLGTPQYIMNMSQPGLSTLYPVYDMPMAADHSFRYNQNSQDVKYNRSDAQDGQVGQSSHGNQVQAAQAPVTQTPNHPIFGQFPPYFFYTGVNMMTQSLYQTAAPFMPVQPNPSSGNVNQPPHAPNSNQPPHSSTGFGPKGAQNQAAYSAAAAAAYGSSAGYDPITGHQLTQGQDFSKQTYSSGPPNSNQNQQQANKQMSSGGSNDLINNNMYTKSHAQLTKNFDKPGAFQTGTPPPFGIATLGYNPNQFIPMMQPQSNPSMLHHGLQGDGNQNVNNSGVSGGQRGSQAQKNASSNSKSYNYNWS